MADTDTVVDSTTAAVELYWQLAVVDWPVSVDVTAESVLPAACSAQRPVSILLTV